MSLSNPRLDWVRQSLRDGHTLARDLLEMRYVEAGVLYTAVPPGFPAMGLDHPEWGQGILGRHRSHEALAELIGATGPRLVVVEDPLMRPTDPVFQRYANESFVLGAEVYHWRLCDRTETFDSMGQFLDAWAAYPVNAVVVRLARRFTPGEEVTRDDVRRLAILTEHIVVGAYDNEGYIVLRPVDHHQYSRRSDR